MLIITSREGGRCVTPVNTEHTSVLLSMFDIAEQYK